MKKRIFSLLLALIMTLGMLPATASAAEATVQWTGAMNFNDTNNQIVNTTSMTAPNLTELKWAYPLNTTTMNGPASSGAYYAGSQVIVGNDLYATGGGRLHKVDITTGTGSPISSEGVTVGSTGNYYDYLCYADGILIVATQNKLEAFSLAGAPLGSVEGTYGYYHPVQYHDGYAFCNGYIYKLEKTDTSATFAQVGTATIGGDAFNWSSGVFLNGLFYTASKTTVYAVDYKTNTVVDSYVFDAERTATYNTQSGPAYDAVTGRLFWGTYTYNSYIHSIQIDSTEGDNKGKFVSGSYMSADAGQKSVCTPIIYNGRVYLPGQQGRMCVLNASDLSQVYSYVTLGGGKVQGNPILSTAGGKVHIYVQCSNGHLYLFTDNGDSGSAVKLAETDNRTDVAWAYAGYEQYAMDSAGNIYCYNESGYLFCFGVAPCEVPTITSDLDTKQVKYALNATEVSPLTVAAEVTDGGTLSYQWQSGTQNETDIIWADISGATNPSYTPSATTPGTTYYRCVVTNTKDTAKTTIASSAAEILVKVLSDDITLNVLVNASNALNNSSTASNTMAAVSTPDSNIVYLTNCTLSSVKNLWLGTVDGTISNFEILQGLASNRSVPNFTSKSTSNAYNGITYSGYYRSNYYTLPIVAKATVTAENGVATKDYYIVIDKGDAAQYTVSVTSFTADNDNYYAAATGISFTAADQTVTLTPATSSIGTGNADTPEWTWSSSDVTVAKVDENGVVTCVGGGEATITASWQKISASCKVFSNAPAHTTHTYVDGACSVCGTQEPSALNAYFTLIGQDGKVVLSKNGTTELYKAQLSVKDADGDGILTLNDAFLVAHETHSVNGISDFVTENSDYGAYITKLWGVQTGSVGYYQNGTSPSGLSAELKRNDVLTAYFYQDTTSWSDIYTSISGQATVSASNATTYTVSGAAGGKAVIPKGASVAVYDNSTDTEVTSMATTVGEDGTFALTFASAGSYTVEVNGTAAYTGQIWDTSLNDGAGGYKDQDFSAAPVILSRTEITVLPSVSKTVYITISMKNGNFAVNKNGDEMYRFPVTATDDATNPDGNVTIKEVLLAAHEQYHVDGASAIDGLSQGFITKLWGQSNSGNCSYYFNDLYMSGSGTKTGSNGRPFQDQLLNTVVEDDDSFYIYSFQTSNWSKGDLYTYFYPVTETATAGTAKTLTVKSAGGYGSNANKLETSLVKVTNSQGVEQTGLNTTVAADGTFTITFPAAGTYTVDIRTNGTNYVTPARCTVTVSAAQILPQQISASISVANPNGGYFLTERPYSVDPGTTAADLLLNTDLNVVSSNHAEYGFYVESINGIGEFDFGSGSGWMFKVNGEFPRTSAAHCVLEDGDLVEWVYTRNLGTDVGDTSYVKPVPETGVITGDSVTLTPEATVNKNGEATVKVNSDVIDSALEQAAEEDGMTAVVISPSGDKDADTVTVELPKSAVSSIAKDSDLNLTVSTSVADVTVSNDGLAELAAKSGSTVSITAETIKDEKGTATGEVKIDVAVNSKTVDAITGGLTVTVPAEDINTGTVLVLVNADGTETIIKKSVSGEKGVTALISGSATVKIVNNRKDFSDVTDHWAENAIGFVAAREVFNGTGTGFAPDAPTNRAMIVATLFRLEEAIATGTHSFSDVPAGTWYTDAVIWANANGIVTGNGSGFDPNGNVTREQLATMLYRYAGHIGMGIKAEGDLNGYGDHAKVSSWASDAMEWAVGTGLITGKPGSVLDPAGSASRAEVATIYQRLIALMVQ